MNGREQLRDLLYRARGITTIRATVRIWRDLRTSAEAMTRADQGRDVVWHVAGAAPRFPTIESVAHLWLEPPDLAREERLDVRGDWYGVRRGQHWWRYDASTGIRTNEGTAGGRSGIAEEFGWLLDPVAAVGWLDLEVVERSCCAFRPTLRVQSILRDDSKRDNWRLLAVGATGADQLLADLDAERGTVLRIESRFRGRPCSILEVQAIAYDERFPETTFVFTPPRGEGIRETPQAARIRRGLTVAEAVTLAPFSVWLPARVADPSQLALSCAVASDDDSTAARVFVHYEDTDGTHADITESGLQDPSNFERGESAGVWSETKRRGRRIEVLETVGDRPAAQVRLVLEGTTIVMRSDDRDVDALADLAAELVRAPPPAD
jgi:hypothetical protein